MAELGYSKLKGARRRVAKLRFGLARKLMGHYRLRDEDHAYRLDPASFRELRRVSSIYLKETGTVELIRREVSEGDVFCDIGANIGLYRDSPSGSPRPTMTVARSTFHGNSGAIRRAKSGPAH